MKGEEVSALALIVIASFVIDRVVSGALFVASFAHIVPVPESMRSAKQRAHAERIYKLMYYIFAGALVLAVLLFFPSIRILTSMGVQGITPTLDTVVTGLLLVGGAERLSEFVKPPESRGPKTESIAEAPPPPPIRVEGTLMLIPTGEDANKIRTTRDFGVPPA